MKKITSLIITLTIFCQLLVPVALATNISVIVDGIQVSFDQPPTIENGRTLVPMRDIFGALGASIAWDEEQLTAIAVKNGITIKIPIGSQTIQKNGTSINIDVPAKIINDRTFIPLRAVAESFDCSVEWNDSTQEITVCTKIESTDTYYEKLKTLIITNGSLKNGSFSWSVENLHLGLRRNEKQITVMQVGNNGISGIYIYPNSKYFDYSFVGTNITITGTELKENVTINTKELSYSYSKTKVSTDNKISTQAVISILQDANTVLTYKGISINDLGFVNFYNTQSTQSVDELMAYEILKNHIISKGSVNGDSNYSLGTNYSGENLTLTYSPIDNNIELFYLFISDSGVLCTCNLTLFPDSEYFKYLIGCDTVVGRGSMPKSSFAIETENVNYHIQTSSIPSFSALGANLIHLTLSSFQEYALNALPSLNVIDLGFTNYTLK